MHTLYNYRVASIYVIHCFALALPATGDHASLVSVCYVTRIHFG